MDLPISDDRATIVAITGPNGAGKTTFYNAHLRQTGFPFINADELASEFELAPYDAAAMADVLRRNCVGRGESFVFETVFTDPVGDKVSFLKDAAERSYNVVLCFIGLSGFEVSEE